MLDYLYETARNWPPAAVSLLMALLAGALLWVTHNRLTRFDDRQVLFRDGTVAYLVQRVALVLAGSWGVGDLTDLTDLAV